MAVLCRSEGRSLGKPARDMKLTPAPMRSFYIKAPRRPRFGGLLCQELWQFVGASTPRRHLQSQSLNTIKSPRAPLFRSRASDVCQPPAICRPSLPFVLPQPSSFAAAVQAPARAPATAGVPNAPTRLPLTTTSRIAWAPTHGMKISSPPGLRYPLTIQALQKRKDEKVNRSDKLFTYWYEELVTESDRWGTEQKVKKRWPQQFDASTEGKITRWFIKPGSVVERAG